MTAALRQVRTAAGEGLPQAWRDELRRTADEVGTGLADELDRAVTGTDLGSTRVPLWQRAVGALQALLAVVLVVGLVWTLGWAVVLWLSLPVPGPVRIGAEPFDLPLPWVLLAASAVAGIALSLLSGPGVRSVARRDPSLARLARLTPRVNSRAASRTVRPGPRPTAARTSRATTSAATPSAGGTQRGSGR